MKRNDSRLKNSTQSFLVWMQGAIKTCLELTQKTLLVKRQKTLVATLSKMVLKFTAERILLATNITTTSLGLIPVQSGSVHNSTSLSQPLQSMCHRAQSKQILLSIFARMIIQEHPRKTSARSLSKRVVAVWLAQINIGQQIRRIKKQRDQLIHMGATASFKKCDTNFALSSFGKHSH